MTRDVLIVIPGTGSTVNGIAICMMNVVVAVVAVIPVVMTFAVVKGRTVVMV